MDKTADIDIMREWAELFAGTISRGGGVLGAAWGSPPQRAAAAVSLNGLEYAGQKLGSLFFESGDGVLSAEIKFFNDGMSCVIAVFRGAPPAGEEYDAARLISELLDRELGEGRERSSCGSVSRLWHSWEMDTAFTLEAFSPAPGQCEAAVTCWHIPSFAADRAERTSRSMDMTRIFPPCGEISDVLCSGEGTLRAMLAAFAADLPAIGPNGRRSRGVMGLRWDEPFEEARRKLAAAKLLPYKDGPSDGPFTQVAFFRGEDGISDAALHFFEGKLHRVQLNFVRCVPKGTRGREEAVRLLMAGIGAEPKSAGDWLVWDLPEIEAAAITRDCEPNNPRGDIVRVCTLLLVSKRGVRRERRWRPCPDPCGIEYLISWGATSGEAYETLAMQLGFECMKLEREEEFPGLPEVVSMTFNLRKLAPRVLTLSFFEDRLFRAVEVIWHFGAPKDVEPDGQARSFEEDYGPCDAMTTNGSTIDRAWFIHNTEIRCYGRYDEGNEIWKTIVLRMAIDTMEEIDMRAADAAAPAD